ncbi:MAG: aminodeoxychorismate/anthranilate synthase component II [Chitinivibrionales bacterium]|nr:aminodeoxychorismate/anthranilate synthase component II [Chitinivibrionales bacterium]
MVLVIDNYDSFTYNLVQYCGEIHPAVTVVRNDAVTVEEIKTMAPKAIIISPGPCTPREAGVSVEAVRHFCESIPILGVCLGHQSIGYAFGGKIIRAPTLMHGKVSAINHDGKTIFKGVPNPFTATRYHSLIIERQSCPACLEISAWTDDNIIMAVRHKKFAVEGVQFHPESILTEHGKTLLKNFLERAGVL